MKLFSVQFMLVFGLVSLLASTTYGADGDLEERIKSVDAKFTRRWVAEKFVGVSNLYTEDAVFLAPGVPAMIGRDELAAGFRNIAGVVGVKKVEFDETYIGPEDEGTSYSFGIYREYGENGVQIGTGHFAIVWDVTGPIPLRRLNIFN